MASPSDHKAEEIRITILGDSGPFSDYGRSIGYMIQVDDAEYLIDCGAPIFDYLKTGGLKRIRGIIGTHSHEDHRRWFTDIALFLYYASGLNKRLRLITTDNIHEEFMKNSRGALERSLSHDSKQVLEIPYDNFVESVRIGPVGKYRIAMHSADDEHFCWRVVDRNGDVVNPAIAKVVINHKSKANRPRLLYRDDASGEWIEPDQYYTFSDKTFFSEDDRILSDPDGKLEIRAIKAHAWHGPPTIGVDLRVAGTRVVFSSDTVYDPELWQELAEEHRPQKLRMTRREFEEAYVVYGNINDLIERTWSKRRFDDAMHTYDGAILIHDVAGKDSVVHTDYGKAPKNRDAFTIFTHSPDRFVSEVPLAITGKVFIAKGKGVVEEVEGQRHPLNAHLYARGRGDEAFVGYKSENGKYRIVQMDDGYLDIRPRSQHGTGKTLFCCNLYRDVDGKYYSNLLKQGQHYHQRPDGKVERLTYARSGSRGVVVRDLRDTLAKISKGRKK